MGLYKIIEKSNLEKDDKEVLNFIYKSIINMDETIREILDYSRNSRNIINNDRVDFIDIIDRAFENSNYQIADFRFDKRINIKEEVPFFSDPSRIKIIVNNIISNALKYGRRDNNSFIEVNVMINDKELILEISDNGIGIKEEIQQNIFGMFYRATTVSTGSGLGLYIAKECTQKLGGTIQFESEFGKGTRFIIKIPNIEQKSKG
jgi:signal transduction histidine kinase